jgi:hypothetical protein
MTGKTELTPFFRRDRSNDDPIAGEGYVAGLREVSGAGINVEITLPAEMVERTVLTDARLSVSLAPDGHLVLDADGLDDETLEAASAAGGLDRQTLESLVADCVDPELLAGEEDAARELTALRGQLVRALAQLDRTLEQLKNR